ncbi:MAG: LamG domain-containing protein, partial [Bacteroidales bacterium]|nr:LamG domain-containing protein [Bacteroidales bacterium]
MVEHSEEDNNKPRCFWIGYSYNNDRSFNGFISEVRMWKKVLTEEEINAPAHFYKLYPDEETGNFPEELVAYWKFDDKKGKIVKDYSIYGNDLTGNQNFIWYPVNLPIE